MIKSLTFLLGFFYGQDVRYDAGAGMQKSVDVLDVLDVRNDKILATYYCLSLKYN